MPLVLPFAAAVLINVVLSHFSDRERGALGLDNEEIVCADDSGVGIPTLRSERYGLVGKPDQLVRIGRMLTPIEQKRTARRAHQSHVLQVAGECLLVYEVYGVRPSHGVLVLAGGKKERVEFTGARTAVARHNGADELAVAHTRGTGTALDHGEVQGVRLP